MTTDSENKSTIRLQASSTLYAYGNPSAQPPISVVISEDGSEQTYKILAVPNTSPVLYTYVAVRYPTCTR